MYITKWSTIGWTGWSKNIFSFSLFILQVIVLHDVREFQMKICMFIVTVSKTKFNYKSFRKRMIWSSFVRHIFYLTNHVSHNMIQEWNTVEPRYNEVLGTMKITLFYQVSHYIRVKKQRNIKSWDQQNDLVITGFRYIRPLYNEVPLYQSM